MGISGAARASAMALAVLAACSLARAGVDDVYVGPTGGLWSDAANWSYGVPNNNASQTYSVSIVAPSVEVVSNTPVTIDELILGPTDKLTASTLTLATGSLISSGTLSVGGALNLVTDAIFTGGGRIVLASPQSGIGSTSAIRLITDNAIEGQGSIGSTRMKVVNTGSITATAGTLTLRADYFNTTVTDSFVNLGMPADSSRGRWT